MTIDTFTKSEFESHLPASVRPLGLVSGEYVYRLIISPKVAIDIRSSVGSDGVSADTGSDSIRAWIFNPANLKPIAGKVDAWTTRVPGWPDRLKAKVEMLAVWQKRAGFCPKCKNPLSIWKAATGKNAGRHMSKCYDCGEWGKIVDDPITDADHAWFDSIWTGAPQPEPTPAPAIETGTVLDVVNSDDTSTPLDIPDAVEVPASLIPTNGHGREPTPEQLAAITTDPGTNNRIMAGPGAGKTYTVELRYEHLVKSGVTPEKILVVTYAKPAADELLARITRTVTISVQAKNQISTIHALCYRIGLAEGDKRHYPDDSDAWKVKATLKDIIEKLWPNADDRPGAEEVEHWISIAKYYGLTSANDTNFYVSFLGDYHGRNQHEARRLFDFEMRRRGWLLFEDMIFEVEQRLMSDPAFRSRWQEKFSEVIVDEGQDTNAQALRILITLSLKPGDNRVYQNWKPGLPAKKGRRHFDDMEE